MNFTTKIKIERPALTTTGRERTLGAPTTVAASEPVRLEKLSGRLLESILGRVPNATHRITRLRRTVTAKANDLVTDLNDGNKGYTIEDVTPIYGGRRLKWYELILAER